jgi:hypothetical protein
MNLIENFIEVVSKTRLYLTNDTNGERQEIYMFIGKYSMLCIGKHDNKVLCELPFQNMTISILGREEFSISINGSTLFFCQGERCVKPAVASGSIPKNTEEEPARESRDNKESKNDDSLYRYKNICDQCSSKKCSQYDALYGRQFKFSKEKVSDDLLNQYNNYCKIKIEKFNCLPLND